MISQILRRVERLEAATRPTCHDSHIRIRYVREGEDVDGATELDVVCPTCGLRIQEYVLVVPEGEGDERDRRTG
jgi:hypothetical protein